VKNAKFLKNFRAFSFEKTLCPEPNLDLIVPPLSVKERRRTTMIGESRNVYAKGIFVQTQCRKSWGCRGCSRKVLNGIASTFEWL